MAQVIQKRSNISASLETLAVDIDSLVVDPVNTRKHGDRNIDAIKASLERFGQMKPIVLAEDGQTIIAGNGTWYAAKALGWARIAASTSVLNDTEAVAYGIADNRTADLAEWDNPALYEILDSMDNEMLDVISFSQVEIDALVPSGNQVDDLMAEWDGMPEYVSENKKPFRSIVVHFKDEDAVEQFLEVTQSQITDKTKYLWYPEMEVERAMDKRYAGGKGQEELQDGS